MTNRLFILVATVILTGGYGSAHAQQGGGIPSFVRDANAPIEVTSDRLEVSETDNTAKFSGDVVVIQDVLRMQTESMKVIYDKGQNTGSDSAGRLSDNSIRQIEAYEGVFVTNGVDTAKGRWAIFDNERGELRMGGGVILTNDDNVVQGDSLEIDLDTGIGKIHGKSGSGRVKALFVPTTGKAKK